MTDRRERAEVDFYLENERDVHHISINIYGQPFVSLRFLEPRTLAEALHAVAVQMSLQENGTIPCKIAGNISVTAEVAPWRAFAADVIFARIMEGLREEGDVTVLDGRGDLVSTAIDTNASLLRDLIRKAIR